MEKNLIISNCAKTIDSVMEQITVNDPGFIIVFYGADNDYKLIEKKLRPLKIPFIGCMDAGRLAAGAYHLDEKTVAGMSFSKSIIDKIIIDTVNMESGSSGSGSSGTRTPGDIQLESTMKFSGAAKKIGIDLDNPDMERDVAINLVYGLASANPFLQGQSEAGLMLQAVGGSSGGKTDFVETNVVSSAGSGHVGVFALIRLAKKFKFVMDRVSSFVSHGNAALSVTKLANPRHILEMNNKPATTAYCEALGIKLTELKPEVFANYTLGIEPGDGERLITSIMKTDDSTGLLTYNDVIPGTQFKLFKTVSQADERAKHIALSLKAKDVIGYLSFDCILCYIARNTLNEVDKIARMYEKLLPGIPKIGFGTFSESICGANINQTETYLAIVKE